MQKGFFAVEDNIQGALITASMDDQPIPIKFLNLSAEGICFQVERSICQKIAQDQVLTLKKNGTDLLAFLDNVKVEVKYILDYDIVPHITVGCKFIELPKIILTEMKKIIEARLTTQANQFQ